MRPGRWRTEPGRAELRGGGGRSRAGRSCGAAAAACGAVADGAGTGRSYGGRAGAGRSCGGRGGGVRCGRGGRAAWKQRRVEGGSGDPDQEFAGEPALYLAVVQDGHTIDIARLLFHGGEPALEADKAEDYYAAAEFSSSEDDQSLPLTLDDYAMVKSNWSDDDWALPSTGGAMSFLGGLGCKENSGIGDWDWDGDGEDADEDEDGDGEDGDGEDEDEDGDGDGEDEDEDEDGDEDGSISGGYDSGDDSECSKEDGDEEHGDTDQDLIKLRIWPAQKHLLLKFFSKFSTCFKFNHMI